MFQMSIIFVIIYTQMDFEVFMTFFRLCYISSTISKSQPDKLYLLYRFEISSGGSLELYFTHFTHHYLYDYFQVNLQKQCPFWTDDSRCALKDCHVNVCQEVKYLF